MSAVTFIELGCTISRLTSLSVLGLIYEFA